MRTRSGFVRRQLKPRTVGWCSIMASGRRHPVASIAWVSLYSISINQIFVCNAETPGCSAQRHRTSGRETSRMSYFLADKLSTRMEIPFAFITERPTHVWRWPLAASVLFFRGWIHTPVGEMEATHSGVSSLDTMKFPDGGTVCAGA